MYLWRCFWACSKNQMYVYWSIECNARTSFVGVFELARIKCMFIGQFNALQELHLWVCLSMQELNVCLLINWMHFKSFICGVSELARIKCASKLANWVHSKNSFVECSNLQELVVHLLGHGHKDNQDNKISHGHEQGLA